LEAVECASLFRSTRCSRLAGKARGTAIGNYLTTTVHYSIATTRPIDPSFPAGIFLTILAILLHSENRLMRLPTFPEARFEKLPCPWWSDTFQAASGPI
jgi:hypothetical protein